MVQFLNERYQSLTPNDQVITKVLSLVILLFVVVFILILPATNYNNKSQNNYKSHLETYHVMLLNKDLFSQKNNQKDSLDGGQSMLGLANSSSKKYGLVFKRFEPVGENGLGLWMEEVSFKNVILWLEDMDRVYGINVTEISVDRERSNGIVSVRIELQG